MASGDVYSFILFVREFRPSGIDRVYKFATVDSRGNPTPTTHYYI